MMLVTEVRFLKLLYFMFIIISRISVMSIMFWMMVNYLTRGVSPSGNSIFIKTFCSVNLRLLITMAKGQLHHSCVCSVPACLDDEMWMFWALLDALFFCYNNKILMKYKIYYNSWQVSAVTRQISLTST